MRKIVAVGGGEIGRPGTSIETLVIDKRIVSLSDKKKPNLLFIPTASSDSAGYIDVVENYYGEKLGCVVDTLCLTQKPTPKEIEQKILSADIIYVGGGNTLKMMMLWRKLGVDKLLERAWKKGTVMSGVSAGAICWFRFGNSDSRKFTSNSDRLIKVRGLGLVPLLFCPHYDVEVSRQEDLKRMMKTTLGVAIACENSAALEIVDGKYQVLSTGGRAYKCYWRRGTFVKTEISKGSVADLVVRS